MMAQGVEPGGSQGVLEAPAPAFSAERAAELAREIFGVIGSAEPLGSERDQNFRIRPVPSSDRDDPGGGSDRDPGQADGKRSPAKPES